MKFIDTHTHLYDEQFENDLDAALQKAIAAGVTEMYLPNCDSTTIEGMLAIEKKWKSHCFPMIGLHPVYVKENYLEELKTVRQWLKKRPFYAIGEIGLDKYWDLTWFEEQKKAFSMQIDWAAEYGIPFVIHSREATEDCLQILEEKNKGSLKGIFHCFGGTVEEAIRITDLGLALGIGGVVTFKKSHLPEVIRNTDLNHIVLETDAPYLAPVPYRGKRNESSYIPLIAQKIADIKNLPLEEVAAVTTQNAEKIFHKPDK